MPDFQQPSLSCCIQSSLSNQGGGGIATNSGLGDLFCIIGTNVVQKSLTFLHCVNNIEHNIKRILCWHKGNLSYTTMILYVKTERMKMY